MEAKKFYTLEEIEDKYIGEKGTPKLLTLLGYVVVHELREIDVRGDGDDALLHSRATVLLGALDVVLVVPAARGADVNLFHVVPPIVSASSGR